MNSPWLLHSLEILDMQKVFDSKLGNLIPRDVNNFPAWKGMAEVPMYHSVTEEEALAENFKNLLWFFTKGPGKDDTESIELLRSLMDD